MSNRYNDDDLAYGDYYGQGQEESGERGIVGDIYKRFRGRHSHQQHSGIAGAYQPQPSGNAHQYHYEPPKPSSSGAMSGLFSKLHGAVHSVADDLKDKIAGREETHGHTHPSGQCSDGTHDHHAENRFFSFAPQREGNDIKWYVDACGYMWAVSIALEQAKESIWIMDWWLSPELYLRRPPAKQQQYRIDRMLEAAAMRGVKVNIIVYKEVTQALTRKYLNPTLPDYLHSFLPPSTDPFTRFLTRLGLDVTFKSLEEVEATNPLIAPPVTVSSSHTKHALEKLHPNIAVFRHPDHLPDRQTMTADLLASFQKMNLTAANAAKLPLNALQGLYGQTEGTVLYWAHHEKLCLVDGKIAFMGGLDLCYGRWDTNQHAIADAHPGNLDDIVFPGQDYNNARIMDFQDVVNWQNNKLDRTKNSRMGWSDLSICISGPVVQDLQNHFVQRWNFIYDEKYNVRKDERYKRLTFPGVVSGYGDGPPPGAFPSYGEQHYRGTGGEEYGRDRGYGDDYEARPRSRGYGDEYEDRSRGYGDEYGGGRYRGFRQELYERGERALLRGHEGGFREKIRDRVGDELEGRHGHRPGGHHHGRRPSMPGPRGPAAIQLTRSCAKWSHGTVVEHSIANAYIEVIRNSQHFVYIENQFFITATNDKQRPIKNKIGAAIVERILRAARSGEKYKVIVMMPAVPAFAGDLKSDDALSTRAIMEFQYSSINRGNGNSIMESIAREGFDPTQYIRFYNLRSYDRINVSGAMKAAEEQSGVSYEEARRKHDEAFGGRYEEGSLRPQPYQGHRPEGYGEPGYGEPGYGAPGYGGPQAYGGAEGYGQPGPYEMDAGYQGRRGLGGYSGQELSGGYDRPSGYGRDNAYEAYQQGAAQIGSRRGLGSGRWDTVSECYMLGGEDIRNVPWEGGNMDEIDAFVSEELYIHSKLLIADDLTVICGSANLNDRSQLGDHDSEIAVVIEDPTPCDSLMDGRPYRASRFAASLRRHIFRKHLGLIPPQNHAVPDSNYEPVGVPNSYDWGSEEDALVADPLSDEFLIFWNRRARINTEAFARVFHPVPYDGVRNWKEYEEFYGRFFNAPKDEKGKEKKPSRYLWGHVVAEEFGGDVRAVKEELAKIRGTLVEMPLLFLKDEDIAQEGLGLNAFTEEVYT